jgi:hypothetical protein
MTRGHALLRDYLRRQNLTPAAFAAALREARGDADPILRKQESGPPYGTVQRVLSGSMPHHATRRSIEIATGGDVPASSWGETP